MTLTVAIPSDDLDESVAQYTWPKECISTELCVKCGDSLELNLHQLRFSENLSRVRAGYYPFGSERAAYDKLLGDTQVELDRCQKEIDRLEILRNKLIASTQLLQANKRLIHSIWSPIHKLPLDLLGNIFEHVCDDMDDMIDISGFDPSKVPTLKFSRVCYRWRSLVSYTPILWSTFYFCESKDDHPKLLPLFLSRSHPRPIDFEVYAKGGKRSSKSLSTLLLHSDRWRHVEIESHFPYVYLLQPLIKSGAQLPSLKSLTLGTGGQTIKIFDFPMTCENLESLTLNRLVLELQFPRPTITRLVLTGMTCESVLGIISRCPNVQDVVLHFLDTGQDLPTPAYKCNANKLELSNYYKNATSTLLRGIHFDQLTSLSLQDDYGTDRYDWQSIENVFLMLERSPTNMTSLSFHFPVASFSINRVLHVFSQMPLLTELQVGEWRDQKRSIHPILKYLIAPQTSEAAMGEMDEDGGGLEELSDDEEDEADLDKDDRENEFEIPEGVCLLPNLTKLRLIIRPRPKLLLKLLRSRWRPSLLSPKSERFSSQESNRLEVVPDHGQCVCLRSFHLTDPCYPKNKLTLRALRRSLESFKNDGMDVTVLG
ncbi:hypothetical protein DFJ43DRAFT_1153961 [Lentinula guzmanii]|uniref:F-box domain-containing protein n=1 Tax=Lentinula guzmanii TaxID=2804957 RepID=A0AA38JCZ9_9AGAR|nr:hypothetical protein DFJ43DRAFT_1153961 [Lentinula guzmanii]